MTTAMPVDAAACGSFKLTASFHFNPVFFPLTYEENIPVNTGKGSVGFGL